MHESRGSSSPAGVRTGLFAAQGSNILHCHFPHVCVLRYPLLEEGLAQGGRYSMSASLVQGSPVQERHGHSRKNPVTGPH